MKVFLCSTYSDLRPERQAVLRAMEDLQIQHESMEFFGARPDRPIDVCLAEVAQSNILVVIVAHKYGSLVPGSPTSYSEAEYKEGHRLRKPCLVYMRDRETPILPDDYEQDPDKLRSLMAFRATLAGRHTVATFRSPADLVESVSSDLLETIKLVEVEQRRREEEHDRRSAFLSELESIALDAVNDGVAEAIVLSALQSALQGLAGRPRGLTERMQAFWRRFKGVLTASREVERPWVYFSYAHSDAKAVRAVAWHLRRFGVRAWVDQQELVAGDSLVGEIQRGLNRASALVFFASRSSLVSQWARHELDFFMGIRVSEGGGPPIIPVLLDDVELPALMRDILYIDMRDASPRAVARQIAAAVRNISSGRFE